MQSKVMIDQGNFKGSDKGPNDKDNKGSKNKLSEIRAMSVKSNTSEIFLQS